MSVALNNATSANLSFSALHYSGEKKKEKPDNRKEVLPPVKKKKKQSNKNLNPRDCGQHLLLFFSFIESMHE